MISPGSYNGRVGLAVFCPITTRVKGYPFEVPVESEGQAEGVVLSDQIKSLDWRARKARKFDRVSEPVMREVAARIGTLVGC